MKPVTHPTWTFSYIYIYIYVCIRKRGNFVFFIKICRVYVCTGSLFGAAVRFSESIRAIICAFRNRICVCVCIYGRGSCLLYFIKKIDICSSVYACSSSLLPRVCTYDHLCVWWQKVIYIDIDIYIYIYIYICLPTYVYHNVRMSFIGLRPKESQRQERKWTQRSSHFQLIPNFRSRALNRWHIPISQIWREDYLMLVHTPTSKGGNGSHLLAFKQVNCKNGDGLFCFVTFR